MPDMGNRLKELRAEMRLTQEMAAARAGMSLGQWRKLEYGTRRLTSDYIEQIAAGFGVDPSAVLGTTEVAIMGYVGAGAEVLPEFEQVVDNEGLDQVQLPFSVPDDIIGFKVRGVSMLPRYDEDDVILAWRDQKRATDSFLGEEAIVRTAENRRFLKTIRRGSQPGLYTLESFNDHPRPDQHLSWVGEIYATIRGPQLRRAWARS